MLEAGVIVNAANDQTIRIAPPLIVTSAQIDKFLATLKKVLKETSHG
jgi:acetylornithine aminotransferase